VSDVAEITALVYEYAFRLDAGDFDGVAELFALAELRSTRHDRVLRGTAEARTLYDPVIVYDDGTPRTMHQITNVTVDRSWPASTATGSRAEKAAGGSPSGSSTRSCSVICRSTCARSLSESSPVPSKPAPTSHPD